MKRPKLSTLLLFTLYVSGACAQKVLFQKSIEGLTQDCKTLANQKYVCSSLISFSPEYNMTLFMEDKKLRQEERKYPSYKYLYAAQHLIRCTESHFYLPWLTIRPLGGNNNGATLEGIMFGKYDNEGNEQWLTKATKMSNTGGHSAVVLPVGNRLRTVYIDSTAQMTTELFSETGVSLDMKTMTVDPFYIVDLMQPDTGKFAVFYKKDDQQRYTYFLSFDNSAQVLADKKIQPDSISAYYESGVLFQDYIYAIISYQDTNTLMLQYFLTKLDREGNVLKQVKLGNSHSTSNYSSICLSTDNKLYIAYNRSIDGTNESYLQKSDLELNTRWSYTLGPYIYGIDNTLCNGILITMHNPTSTVSLSSSTLEIIHDPDFPDICGRCGISVYPNPSTDGIVTFQTHHPDVAIQKTEWYDSNGKMVWEALGSENLLYATPLNLASGIYYTITTCENDKSVNRKVIIAK